MRKETVHFKKKHPIRRFLHRLRLTWSLYWSKERIGNLLMYIAGTAFMLLMLYMFLMGD